MKKRSNAKEWMDDLEMEGPVLRSTLKSLARINSLLGGDAVSLRGVKKIGKQASNWKDLHIVDLGCGEGSQLRLLADYSRKNQLSWRFTGIDANKTCVTFARERSAAYPEIEYLEQDVFTWQVPACDIVIATLFMHHFDNRQIVQLLEKYDSAANLGWVINDLHRSRLAYTLFWCFSLFVGNRMIRHDGLLSIKKGFKKKELFNLGDSLAAMTTVTWHWAFRYLWIQKR